LLASPVNPCTTPDGFSGTLTYIHSCPYLLQIQQNFFADKRLLQLSYAGFHNGISVVCCRNNINNNLQPPQRKAAQSNHQLPKPDTCGRKLFEDRIVGGNETLINEFPWLARLQYRSSKLNTKPKRETDEF